MNSNSVVCDVCSGYLPGHATGGFDICTCEPIARYIPCRTLCSCGTPSCSGQRNCWLSEYLALHSIVQNLHKCSVPISPPTGVAISPGANRSGKVCAGASGRPYDCRVKAAGL